MKKTSALFIVIFILSFCLPVFCLALIEQPPKDKDIKISVYRTEEKPELDGVIGEGEYKELHVKKTSLSQIVGSELDWSRVKNASFTAYGAVCGDVFYFALSAPMSSEYYITEAEPKNLWAQTALLLAFAKAGTTGRNALEFGVRPDGASYVWQTYGEVDFSANGRFAAKYENETLTYETAIPLSAFGAEGDDSFLFCFSLSIGDYYSGERQAYVQFGQGITGFSSTGNADAGKDASLFPTVHILSEGETEPEETDENNGENTPDTSLDVKSAALICAVVMAASLAGAAVMRLKIKN